MDTKLGKGIKGKITCLKQNKLTFISQRPCSHDHIEIIEVAEKAVTQVFQIITVLLFGCLK